MKKVLIIRLSAMGDVAMTVPVIQQLIIQYPNTEFHLLTRSSFIPIFEKCAPQLQLIAVDPFLAKGFFGIFELFKLLSRYRFHAIADLHNVLRTKILKLFFSFKRIGWASLDKKRADRKNLIAKHKTYPLKPLPAMYENHLDVFKKINFPISIQPHPIALEKTAYQAIGFAPFSKHVTKNWQQENNSRLIEYLLANTNADIFLFGDQKNEGAQLQELCHLSSRVKTTFDLDLKAQLDKIEQLDFLISMDSANMHLASAVGTKVFSVWCATSPLAGFMGYNQTIADTIQVTLPCRPCSIYGNKKCWRGDLACTKISMDLVAQKLDPFIS